LVKIGLAHAQFETIHPFRDGNGRIGRLLITLLLCRHSLLNRPILYLSYYLRLNRTEYYDRLQAVREQGDWEGWLQFFLLGVTIVASDATRLSQAIVSLREAHRELILSASRRPSTQLKLLDMLYDHPVVTIRLAEEMLGVTFPTANRLVQSLVTVGILIEMSGRERDRVFGYHEYLALLEA
jgi:Fic family protein